jgi:L-threonylcarbamoyladenylate synthase
MERIKINDRNIKRAGEVIRRGGLVVFPSDTVYILAVDPTNQKAVDKLLGFKNRWTGKAISVAVANKPMAMDWVVLGDNEQSIYSNLLPGPFTIVSEGKHKMAVGIEAENGTLGVRIPDNEWIKKLVLAVGGPVTATSANLSGRTPHYSVESLLETLSKKKVMMIDLIVDAGKLPRNKPSTVIDATEGKMKILRRGDLITKNAKFLISKTERETEKIANFIFNKITNYKPTSSKQVPNTPSETDSASLRKFQITKQKPVVLALSGDLGCGKTVFTRGVAKALGISERITSPTFNIYNSYELRVTSYELKNVYTLICID